MALRDKLRRIVGIQDSPGKIALSFGIGVFVGMSPLLGLHTILGILFAWLFRLNKFVTIVGVYITNPWTIVPIYTFATWLGAKLLGLEHILPDVNWHTIGITGLVKDLEPILPSFVVGTTFLGVACGIIGYVLIYFAVIRHRKSEGRL